MQKGLHLLVADAVAVEPVSSSKFPDIPESAGKFCNLQGIGLETQRKERPKSRGYGQNSLSNKISEFSLQIWEF